MKKPIVLFCILLPFFLQAAVLIFFTASTQTAPQDTIAVNEILKTAESYFLQNSPDTPKAGQDAPAALDSSALKKRTLPDFAVLDKNGHVLWKSKDSVSDSIHAAIQHRDTILDICPDKTAAGKLIIDNTADELFAAQKQTAVRLFTAFLLLQAFVLALYALYFERNFIRPFQKLEHFAQRVAGGNLDIPLAMDRKNIFGAFTESFDLMRTELKNAKLAEARASEQKKELAAKLSHDIRTPAASIKAASELGFALSESERMKDNYTQIIRKADQINALITDLFTATLKELRQLPVEPSDTDSRILCTMLENADYLHRAVIPDIPECLLYADKLRLQQVIDNIFANSYKYAGTDIRVTALRKNKCLILEIEDYGGGVPSEELALIKQKFQRGSNAKDVEGAGLGLYISDYFMQEMGGELVVENGSDGLNVKAVIMLA